MRYRFNEIFQENNDDSLTPRMPIYINGVTIGPGVSFRQGVAFGGINFFNLRGFDIEAENEENVLKIKGFYRN